MQGIRVVAGMRNEKALRVLMKIYKQDPDEEVRQLAKKGASVVAERLRELKAAQEAEEAAAYEDPLAVEDVEVSERDERRAKEYLNEAMDHQMVEDREKAMTALKKALDANPNLAKDNYFQSVAGTVMDEEDSEDAVRALVRDDKRKNVAQEDRKRKVDAEIADHMATAEKFTWASLMIDIALFSLVMFLGGLLSVMVIDFSAEQRINQLTATLEGTTTSDGEVVPPDLDPNNPDDAEAIIRTETNREVAIVVMEVMNVGLGALFGVTLLFMTLPALISYGLVMNPVATRLFDGNGTATYAIHNLLNVYITPSLVAFAVVIVVALLVFFVGVPLGVGLIMIGGILGVISLVVTIRMLLAISKTYKFGLGPAILTAIVASIPANIIMAVIGAVFGVLLGGALAALNTAVGTI